MRPDGAPHLRAVLAWGLRRERPSTPRDWADLMTARDEVEPYGAALARWSDATESLRAAREDYALVAKSEGYTLALRLVLEHTEFIWARCDQDDGLFTGAGAAKNIEMMIRQRLAEEEDVRGRREPTSSGMLLVRIGLPPRAYRSLRASGYLTVDILVNASELDIAKLRNIGRKTRKVIWDKLDSIGSTPLWERVQS